VDDWHHRKRFSPGDWYVDADGQFKLQYLGIVTALLARQLVGDRDNQIDTADDTEPVMLFRVVVDEADARLSHETHFVYYTHTKSDADRGYHFIKVAGSVPTAHR
jgi:hypothetical protein